MKNLIYVFITFILLSCIGQTKINENENTNFNITTTYPKINLRKIDKTWNSLNAIQKDWIKVEKDKNGYLIYQPCDGETETIQIEGAQLTINWRIENS